MRATTTSLLLTISLLGWGCGDEPRPESPGAESSDGDEAVEAAPGSSTQSDGETATTPPADGEVTEVLEGRASYYADSLAGNSTASGEPYDPSALTAASRDLPFGTRVRVTRLGDDGQPMGSVVVRVNDRGPHRDHSRILDLSRAAAEELDMIRAGVVDIRAEILAD